jgi:hypothetical protein
MIYYHGYPDYLDQYEFYDLQNDPDELENRYPGDPLAGEMKEVVDGKFAEINQAGKK